MDTIIQTLISLIPSLLAVVGVYVNLTREVERLRGRVFNLESIGGRGERNQIATS